jgi:hypothetical protein
MCKPSAKGVSQRQANPRIISFPSCFQLNDIHLSINDGLCFFTQVGKYGRANDEEEIFEQREIKNKEENAQDQFAQNEEKAKPAVLIFAARFLSRSGRSGN